MHIYSTRRLRSLGLSRNRIAREVASGGLTRLRRGIYAAPGPIPP